MASASESGPLVAAPDASLTDSPSLVDLMVAIDWDEQFRRFSEVLGSSSNGLASGRCLIPDFSCYRRSGRSLAS